MPACLQKGALTVFVHAATSDVCMHLYILSKVRLTAYVNCVSDIA